MRQPDETRSARPIHALLLAHALLIMQAGACHSAATVDDAKAWVEALENDGTAWSFSLAGPLIVGTGTYVDPDDTEVRERALQLTAWDAASGRLRWTQPLDNVPVAGPVWVADATTLIGVFDRYVAAFDVQSGEQRWLRGPFEGGVDELQLQHGRAWIVAQDDAAVVVDAGSGALRWAFDRDDVTPLAFGFDDGAWLVAQQRRADGAPGARVHVFDATAGASAEPVWSERVFGTPAAVTISGAWLTGTFSHDAQAPRRLRDGTAPEVDDASATGTWAHGVLIRQQRRPGEVLRLFELEGHDPGSEEARWRTYLPATAALTIEPAEAPFVALSSPSGVRLLDARTGAVRWQLDAPDDGCVTIAALREGLAVRCDDDTGGRLELRRPRGES